MDDRRFDALTRGVFSAGTRRAALGATLAGLGLYAASGLADARNKKKKKKKRRCILMTKCGDECCDPLEEVCTSCGCCPPVAANVCCSDCKTQT